MMMEAKKESYINQRLSSLHDGSKDENDTRDAAKVGGSVHHSSQEREESSSVADDSDSSQRLMADGEKKSKRRDFPSKLHEMLHDSKTQGREHIISWGPDGTSFKVHQPEDFVAEVMPKYFKQTKYRSFQRMLNLYNFKKIIVGPMRGGYIHPKFIRDGKEQCNTMKIRTRASTKSACRDHSDYRPSPNALRKVDDQKSATSPIGDCDDQLSSPQKMPIGMSHPFTSIMHNRQPVNPFFYRQENVASTEMKDASSSRLDFSDQFTRQQQVEQQNLSSFPVASVPDHSIYSPAWDVEMCDNPMSPTPVGNPPSDQDFTFQTTAISFVDYDRIFHEPLSDDLEPRHLPPENFDHESR